MKKIIWSNPPIGHAYYVPFPAFSHLQLEGKQRIPIAFAPALTNDRNRHPEFIAYELKQEIGQGWVDDRHFRFEINVQDQKRQFIMKPDPEVLARFQIFDATGKPIKSKRFL